MQEEQEHGHGQPCLYSKFEVHVRNKEQSWCPTKEHTNKANVTRQADFFLHKGYDKPKRASKHTGAGVHLEFTCNAGGDCLFPISWSPTSQSFGID